MMTPVRNFVKKHVTPKNIKKVHRFAKTAISAAKYGRAAIRSYKNSGGNKRRKTNSGRGSARITGKGLAGESWYQLTEYKKPKKTSAYTLIKTIGNGAQAIYNASFSLQATESLQIAKSYCGGMTYADIQDSYLKIAGEYNATTATAIRFSSNQPNYLSHKLCIKECLMKNYFTNQSAAVTNVILYHVISKVTKVTAVFPETDWNSGLVDQGAFNTQRDNTAIGARPTYSKLFNMNWKIVGTKSFQLMGGETYTDTWCFKPNRTIDAEYTGTYQQIRGLTCYAFAIAWGQTADSSNAYAVGNIGTTPVKLIGTQTRTYKWSIINAIPRITYQQGNQLSVADTATLYVVNEEAGNVINEASAGGASVYA